MARLPKFKIAIRIFQIISGSTHTDPYDMADNIYDEIEIEDMTYDPTLQIYHYPCPCGDKFEIGINDLRGGEDIAVCPSCSLMIRVIFEVVNIISAFLSASLLTVVLSQDDLPKPPPSSDTTNGTSIAT